MGRVFRVVQTIQTFTIKKIVLMLAHFLTTCCKVVRQVKLKIQALINILIFTELLILNLPPLLHGQYCGNTKTQPSPFRPNLSETKWLHCAACA